MNNAVMAVLQRFLELLLPSKGSGEFRQENLQELRQQGQDIFGRLEELFVNPSGSPNDQADDFAAVHGEWAQLLETVYPAADYGRCRLHLYVFPKIQAGELFMETFGRDEDQQQLLQQKEGEGTTVIGWLESTAVD